MAFFIDLNGHLGPKMVQLKHMLLQMAQSYSSRNLLARVEAGKKKPTFKTNSNSKVKQ